MMNQLLEKIREKMSENIVDDLKNNAILLILKNQSRETKVELFKLLSEEENRLLSRMSDELYRIAKYYRDIIEQKAKMKFEVPITVEEFRKLVNEVGGEDQSQSYPPEAEVVNLFSSHPDYGDVIAFLLRRDDFKQGADVGFVLKENLYKEEGELVEK